MDGKAIIYCQGAFGTTTGKTANGLVRFTKRYEILCVIDSRHAGRDAGEVLGGMRKNIPIEATLDAAISKFGNRCPKYFVVGIAPDGGKLPPEYRAVVLKAIEYGLYIDSGLHTFLSDDREFSNAAKHHNIKIRDVRKTPPRDELHFWNGDIKEVQALRIATLGTDSAIGKRTTAVSLTNKLIQHGILADMIGTGQTAWMQGWEHSLILDSLINDFVSGEIEYNIVASWRSKKPEVILIEGQGCITNPAYPGGFEILAAGKPDLIILQHAPKRIFYDGFPGVFLAGLDKEMKIIELLTDKQIFAIAINHEDMNKNEIEDTILEYEKRYNLISFDAALHEDSDFGIKRIIPKIKEILKNRKG